MDKIKSYILFIAMLPLMLSVASCARMGNPDGGWYDEEPPKVISTFPLDGAVNVREKKITISFDEYVTIDNPTENVIISPPQLEQPEVKPKGKSIVVELKDTLKENTTYTVDFSNAIKDNNENNLMGNYTYSFSTGEAIDTMEVGGYVLEAETLEPVAGSQVGLYLVTDSIEADTTIINRFYREPLLRVSRTDQSGHFSVKGVKPGRYRVYALMDVDNNFMLTPRSGEKMAFYDETVVPSVFDDVRQDTTMLDSLRIKSIERVQYKHFMPDNVMLRAFTEPKTDRALLKSERVEPEKLSFYFTYGDSILPEIKGLNFDFENSYVLEASAKKDTLTYWLKDTALVNTDSLDLAITYRMTDTLGVLQNQTDTLQMIPRIPFEKRLKLAEKEREDWEKKEEKKKKKGEPYDSIMPPKPLEMNIASRSSLDPDKNITIEFPTPLMTIDTAKIHLYIERDSVWYNAKYELKEKPNTNIRTLELSAEWQPGLQYSLETDSVAFVDIYGKVANKNKLGLKVKALEEFGTFEMTIQGMAGRNVIAQLLNQSGNAVKEVKTADGVAKFYYISEGTYYMRIIIDDNNNGIWDTGEYDSLRQPEQVYYFPKEIECRAKWDIRENWNPEAKPLNEQKPSKLKKAQSSNTRRNEKGKNLRRAQELGIELPEHLK